MPAAIGEVERKRIVGALLEGGKRNEVARRFGRSAAAISKIAVQEGVEFDRSHTKKASAAVREYAKRERLDFNNELFEKLREMVRHATDANDVKNLIVSYGILTEKRRLEDGEATDRREQHNLGGAREQRFERLFSQLDEYRSGQDAGRGGGDRGVRLDSGGADA